METPLWPFFFFEMSAPKRHLPVIHILLSTPLPMELNSAVPLSNFQEPIPFLDSICDHFGSGVVELSLEDLFP